MSCWAAPFRVPLVYPTLREYERIAAPGVGQIRFQLFLSRAHPGCIVLLGNSHALVAQQNRDSFRWALQQEAIQQRTCRGSACPFGTFASLKSLRNRVCQLRTILSSFPLPLQKENFSVTFGVASNADKTNPGRIVFTGTPVFCV